MSYNPILTDQEFAQIHAGIVSLRTELSGLDTSALAPDSWTRMSEAVSAIESAVMGAHVAGQAVLELRSDYYRLIQREQGFSTQWNISAVRNMDNPHPWPHARRVIYSLPWRDMTEVAVPIEGGTWLDLYRAADRAIALNGESRYTGIEAFSCSGAEPEVLVLFTGAQNHLT